MINLIKTFILFVLISAGHCSYSQEIATKMRSTDTHGRESQEWIITSAVQGAQPHWDMKLNMLTGDLLVVVINFSKEPIRFDIDSPFSLRHPYYTFLSVFQANKIFPSDITTEPFSESWNNKGWIVQRHPVVAIHPNNYPPKPQNKIVDLKQKEGFTKRIKIWDIDIWQPVKESLNENPKRIYKLFFKIVHNKPNTEAYLMVDAPLVQQLENVKKKLISQGSTMRQYEFETKPVEWYLAGNHFKEPRKKKVAYPPGTVPQMQCQLKLQIETDELTLSLENPIDVVTTVDIEQPFLETFQISESFPNKTVSTGSQGQRTEQSIFQKYRAIDLEEGEGFSKTVKIWELDIWSKIQAFFERNHTKSCNISNEISCWIEGKEYIYSGKLTLNYVTFQKLQEHYKRKELPK